MQGAGERVWTCKEGGQCNNLMCVLVLVVGWTVLLFYVFIFSTLHVITPLVLYIDSKFVFPEL